MLRSTPQLLRKSAVSVTDKLHNLTQANVPLTTQESERLLKLITASFRTRLDKEYGPAVRTDAAEQPLPASSSTKPSSRRGSMSHDRRVNMPPTDSHLSTVLSNPLFSSRPSKIEDRPTSRRDPMEVFDEACARGLMTVDLAIACLRAKRYHVATGESIASDAARDSGPGMTVLKWLISNGITEDYSWLKARDGRSPHFLFVFLLEENQHGILWTLFKRYLNSPGASMMLWQIIKAERPNMDAAYRCLFTATEIMEEAGLSPLQASKVLERSISYLVYLTTFKNHQNTPASEAVYDSFVKLVEVISDATTPKRRLYSPYLALCHPTRPDASKACSLLKELDALEGGARHFYNESAPPLLQQFILMSLRAAQVLFQQHKRDEARWVMDFLERAYPDQIGAQARVRQLDTSAEKSMLELLKRLDLSFGSV